LFIRGLVGPFDSLWALVWWQTLAGILTALLAWHVLVSRLHVSPRLAFVTACLIALEPAQLYYERMVLAEAVGLLAFVTFFASAAAYLAGGRWWWLPVVTLTGLAAATLRLNYLPVVLVISIVVPFLRRLVPSPPAWRQVAVHALVACACVIGAHGSFQRWVAWIFKSPPGYIARAGFMQLGLVLPLVKPHHLERVGLPSDFGTQLRFPLSDPDARMSHMWAPGGFVRTLRERSIPVEPVARSLVRLALADDPLGLLRLGLHTTANYFRADAIAHARDNDLGRRVIPEEILWTLREIWHYDASGLWNRATPVSWYFERGTWLLVLSFFLLTPVVVANAWLMRASPDRAQAVLLALVGVGLVLAHILFVPVAFYRYMHPIPWFVAVAGCAVASLRRHLH
jgi:hypothetical protein